MTAGHRSRGALVGLAGSTLAHLSIGIALVMALSSAPGRPSEPVTRSPAATPSQAGTEPRGFSAATADGEGDLIAAATVPVQRVARAISTAAKAEVSSPRLVAHLWESTIVAAVVALLALLFRRHGAHVRYWLWLAASMKFFVPFSILATAGTYAGALLPAPPLVQQLPWAEFPAVDPLMAPSLPADWVTAPAPGPSAAEWALLGAFAVWVLGTVALAAMRFRIWRRVTATVRASTPLNLPNVKVPDGVELRSAAGLLEPGVVGWRRPVLLLPNDMERHLSPAQLDTVIAHELCHIMRRDNLTATLHMLTEAIFWFHPVVWWIGARLIIERERACDEAVVAGGCEPVVYAHAIVNTCALYTASPVACVAGVTGGDLRRRVEAILKDDRPRAMKPWSKALVLVMATLALAVPIVRGVSSAIPVLSAEPLTELPAGRTLRRLPEHQRSARVGGPAFEVASVRRSAPNSHRFGPVLQPGGRVVAVNVPVRNLVRTAYGIQENQIIGGPAWIDSDGYDIEGRVSPATPLAQVRLMFRAFLAERFQLLVHQETRQLPVLVLRTLAPGSGPRGSMKRSGTECAAPTLLPGPGGPPPPPPPPGPGMSLDSDRQPPFRCPNLNARGPLGFTSARAVTLDQFAAMLSPVDGRPVRNGTGVEGEFDFDLRYTPDLGANDALPPGVNAPGLATALREQLGLRLDPERAPIEVLVIDRVARPAGN